MISMRIYSCVIAVFIPALLHSSQIVPITISQIYADILGREMYDLLKNGKINEAREHIKAGANCNIQGYRGDTLLQAVIRCPHRNESVLLKLIEELLQAGVDPNIGDEYGFTPLMSASTYGTSDILLLLLHNGVDINAQTKLGNTALHYAAESFNDDALLFASLLLEHGANPDIKNLKGQTPYQAIIMRTGRTDQTYEEGQKEKQPMLKLLKKYPKKPKRSFFICLSSRD